MLMTQHRPAIVVIELNNDGLQAATSRRLATISMRWYRSPNAGAKELLLVGMRLRQLRSDVYARLQCVVHRRRIGAQGASGVVFLRQRLRRAQRHVSARSYSSKCRGAATGQRVAITGTAVG